VATPIQVLVPDIGGFKDVSVIDVLVKDGQQIDKETPLITIETEKAAMDVPAPVAGRITQVTLKLSRLNMIPKESPTKNFWIFSFKSIIPRR